MSYILDTFFTATTMSVHIQKGQKIVSKKGKPGARKLYRDGKLWTKKQVLDLIQDILQAVENSEDGYIEIQRSASTVIQLWPYRIVIVEPPVANTHEITIVRPVAKLLLADYTLSEDMTQRLLHDAKGILIAWAPGEGKTTFAQALIEEIAKQEVIIKTIESPRDLVVSSSITQYSFSHAPHDEIRDILLLSRPDYSVYDEVRNTPDFHLYTDLRLTGIGLIGVMHATQAIDAIQRFIGVLNMGTVAQVIDTIIFIQSGQVAEILALEQVVTTPSGMTSEDLARPVIYVHSLLSKEKIYEIYSYGDNVVVMPLDKVSTTNIQKEPALVKYAKQAIQDHIQELIQYRCHIEITWQNNLTLYVPPAIKGRVIGRQGARIEEIQKITWFSISVRDTDELKHIDNKAPSYHINEIQKGKKTILEIQFPDNYKHTDIRIMIGDQIMTFTANHKGIVTIRRKKLIQHIQNDDIQVIG